MHRPWVPTAAFCEFTAPNSCLTSFSCTVNAWVPVTGERVCVRVASVVMLPLVVCNLLKSLPHLPGVVSCEVFLDFPLVSPFGIFDTSFKVGSCNSGPCSLTRRLYHELWGVPGHLSTSRVSGLGRLGYSSLQWQYQCSWRCKTRQFVRILPGPGVQIHLYWSVQNSLVVGRKLLQSMFGYF